MYTHIQINTNINTIAQKYMHIYAYNIHTQTYAYIPIYMNTYMHTYIHTHIHTYLHTYIYIYAYLRIYTNEYMQSIYMNAGTTQKRGFGAFCLEVQGAARP